VIQKAISGVIKWARVGTTETQPERSGQPGPRLSQSVRRVASMGNRGDSRPGQDPSELIEAVAAHQDRSAFAALFGLYAPRVKMLLMRMGAPEEAAEDIAQETLLMVWRKAAYYDPSRATASAWIFAIARNLRLDRLRRDKRVRQHSHYHAVEQEELAHPDGALNAMEREQQLRRALDQLSDDQARVLRLSFFEGRSHSDIAELLDIPLGTVKSRVRLALSRLRGLLGHIS
jgi:RNA polymerase sigma-70 factor, ECF subfamily